MYKLLIIISIDISLKFVMNQIQTFKIFSISFLPII